jgi:hypothetical protein
MVRDSLVHLGGDFVRAEIRLLGVFLVLDHRALLFSGWISQSSLGVVIATSLLKGKSINLEKKWWKARIEEAGKKQERTKPK